MSTGGEWSRACGCRRERNLNPLHKAAFVTHWCEAHLRLMRQYQTRQRELDLKMALLQEEKEKNARELHLICYQEEPGSPAP